MESVNYGVVFNRKKTLSKNGTALVQVSAYLNRRRIYFSTKQHITPDQWDSKHQKIKNHPNALKINRHIADLITKLQGVELDRRNANKPFKLDLLLDFVNGQLASSFTDFMRMEIDNERTTAKATKTGQITTLNALQDFNKQIPFEQITFELLTDFERYLLNKNLSINTIHKYFRHIRKFVNLAINKDMMDLNKYPFRKFKLKSETTTRDFLDNNELKALENLILPPKKLHLQKTLDMFLFSCYTGLRFSDASALNKDEIQIINGDKWIILIMQKTNEPIRLPIAKLFYSKAISILDTYTKEDRKYIFDDITNQYANRSLKDIATLAGIKKTVTFHTSRHTFGTILTDRGIPATTIKKLMGHKKLETTLIYSKTMDTTVINELEAVFSW